MDMNSESVEPTVEQIEQLVIEILRLEEVGITSIDPSETLFGAGLGLDSIDALELALAVSKTYGVTIRSDDPNVQQIFGSIASLTRYIREQRVASST